MHFHRYVAIGDSQTEGLNDLDAHGGVRGWADRFAVYLAESNPDLLYANLAIRGRRTKRIRADQLEPALALNPDLVSVMAGVNDVLGSFDLDETMTELEEMYAALRGSGATVIGCTFPDPGATLQHRPPPDPAGPRPQRRHQGGRRPPRRRARRLRGRAGGERPALVEL